MNLLCTHIKNQVHNGMWELHTGQSVKNGILNVKVPKHPQGLPIGYHCHHLPNERNLIMGQKEYILKFIETDELLSVQFSDLKEGEARLLEDGEEYTMILKLKHIKSNWEK